MAKITINMFSYVGFVMDNSKVMDIVYELGISCMKVDHVIDADK